MASIRVTSGGLRRTAPNLLGGASNPRLTEDYADDPNIERAIKEFRRTLPDFSKTARAIDCRRAPSRIALVAAQEGYKGYRTFAIELLELIEASPGKLNGRASLNPNGFCSQPGREPASR
jgi:hypothetical protein